MSGNFIRRSRHGTVFYFRRRVPRELRARIGRVHFYASLHTHEPAEAKRRARALAVLTDQVFAHVQRARSLHESRLDQCDDESMIRGGSYNRPSINNGPAMNEFFQSNYEVSVQWDAALGKATVRASDVKQGEEASAAALVRLLLGVVDEAGSKVQPPAVAAPLAGVTPTVAEAIAAKLASPELKPTTRKEYKRAFDLFAARMGVDTPLGEIPQARFAEFADYVTSLPNLAAKTKNSLMVAAGTLYSFYNSRNDAVPKITTKGLKAKRIGPPQRRRDFSLEELEVVFRNALKYRERKSAKWWITVVPVFLGGRVEELTQAHIDADFLRDPKSGIHYLKIDEGLAEGADEAFPKSVKTEAGWRKVPIHPALIEAGFLDYLAAERAAGAITPFQRQWSAHRDDQFGIVKHSHAISKWGGRELDKLQASGKLPDDKELVYFHSMRHSFVTLLAAEGVDEEWRSALAGHEFGKINSQVYNQAKNDVAVTLPIIERGLNKLAAMFKAVT